MESQLVEMESLCLECQKQGTTRLYPLEIPGFGPCVISSFWCSACGNKNTDTLPISEIASQGIEFTCLVRDEEDLRRMLVRGIACSVRLCELDIELAPGRGYVTTVEGLLTEIRDNLEVLLKNESRLQEHLDKIDACLAGKAFLTIVLCDPAGNSHLERRKKSGVDPALRVRHFFRSQKQSEQLGLIEGAKEVESEKEPEKNEHEEVCRFSGNCPACCTSCETRMSIITIPHFGETVLMSTTCDACGFRDGEVKAGGGVAEKGTRITLLLTGKGDLARDVLKAESCVVRIPEIDLELTLGSGMLGGRITTVEGLLCSLRDGLEERRTFLAGDSAEESVRRRFEEVAAFLDALCRGEETATLILDDPLSKSRLSNPFAPERDPQVESISYTRTQEQDEELGLHGMNADPMQIN